MESYRKRNLRELAILEGANLGENEYIVYG